MDMSDELDRLRSQIDAIDAKMVELFRERMDVSMRIAAYKREHGLPILAAGRERAVLDRVSAQAGPELAAYAETLIRTVMACSRDYQKMRCGLVGMPLGHSFSPAIHAKLADYDYRLYELTQEQLGPFLRAGRFDGLNITIPYKKTAMAFCDELTAQARHVGCVNTIVRRADGTLLGHNTDYDGFCYLLRRSGTEVRGKRPLSSATAAHPPPCRLCCAISAPRRSSLSPAGVIPIMRICTSIPTPSSLSTPRPLACTPTRGEALSS